MGEKKKEEAHVPASLQLPPPRTVEEKPLDVKKSEVSFKALEQLLASMEVEYRRIKATNLEDLHNELAEVIVRYINERKVTVDTVLLALEIIKYEMVTQKIQQLERGIPIEKVL